MNQDETMVMLKAKDLQGIQDELKAYKDLVRHLYDELTMVKDENARLTDCTKTLMGSVRNWQEINSSLLGMNRRALKKAEELRQELSGRLEKNQ